jgi:hypothetical protein
LHRQHHIPGLQVAMDNAARMRSLERVDNLTGDA